MIRTLMQAQMAGLGVRTDRLLTLRVPLAETRYPEPARRAAVIEDLLERLAGAPGVEAVAANSWWHPLGNFSVPVQIPSRAQQDSRRVTLNPVSSGYLSVYGIPLKSGRGLTRADVRQGLHVALVSERFVRRYFEGRDALGQMVSIPALKEPPMRLADDRMEIIGIVADTASGGLEDERPELYFPHTIAGVSNCLTVRAAGEDPMSALPAVREAVRALDKDQPVTDVKAIEARMSEQMFAGRRFNAILFGVFAFLGLALAAVGIYGVLANSVSRRTNEIGVRMAMGAAESDIYRMVLGEGAKLLLIGVALGTLTALATSRLLARIVWKARVFDPVTLGTVALLLVIVGVAACWLPARHGARVEPMSALRFD
jgi:predicted permease